MNLRHQQLCIWCGLVFGNLFFIGVYLLAFFPPPPATLTGEEFIASIQNNLLLAKLGIISGLWATFCSIAWNSVIALHVARAEGFKAPLMAIVSFGGGMLNSVAFMLVFVLFAPAVFRLERDPELVRLMVDFSWLLAIIVFSGFVIQCLANGMGGLLDKREQPVFPRWVCFFLFWIAILSTPGVLALYFKTGPFSWNGILTFWIPATAFGVYLVVMTIVLLKAAKGHMAELAAE